jgi:hypothetical protein
VVSEPAWYAVICVLAHCDDGGALAHAWSSGYPQYSPAETEAKLRHAKADSGPTTCQHFHSLTPELCLACRYWGKIRSPAQLGHPGGVQAPATPGLSQLPEPYFYSDDGKLTIKEKGKDGEWRPRTIYEHWLEVIAFAREEGVEGRLITIRHWLPHDGWKQAHISMNNIEMGAVMSQLMQVGVNVRRENYSAMFKYLQVAIDHLLGKEKTGMVFDQMGWKLGCSFLFGAELYEPSARIRAVPVTAEMEKRARLMETRGNYKDWAVAANALFQKGYEGQALALLCSFAAPLMIFVKSAGGCIVHAVSPTGQGKSMGLRAAWTAWGAEHAIDLNRIDTQNARFREIALLSHIPIIFDELQERDEAYTKDFILSFTEGRDKRRLDHKGKSIAPLGGWSTIIISASNKSLAQTVVSAGEQAGGARVLEYQSVLPEDVDPKRGPKLEKVFEANRGWAARKYLEGLVEPATRDWADGSCQHLNAHYQSKLGRGTEHRFYAALLACCDVAGRLLNHWEMLEFDTARIVDFAFEAARSNRQAILEQIPDYPRLLQEMINTSIKHMLIVNDESSSEPLVRPTSGELYVRIEKRAQYAWIDRRALRNWCTRQHAVFAEMERELMAKEVVIETMKNLGQGTAYDAAGAIPVWRVNLMSRHMGRLEIVTGEAQTRWRGEVLSDAELARDARERL